GRRPVDPDGEPVVVLVDDLDRRAGRGPPDLAARVAAGGDGLGDQRAGPRWRVLAAGSRAQHELVDVEAGLLAGGRLDLVVTARQVDRRLVAGGEGQRVPGQGVGGGAGDADGYGLAVDGHEVGATAGVDHLGQ